MSGSRPEHVLDPVCGMTVGLAGCLLEFRDEPEKYLDPAYAPSM